MLKNVLLSGLLATAFSGIFSTANAMEPDERELYGTVIKQLLKDQKYTTKTENIKVIQTVKNCNSEDVVDIWKYTGRKNLEGTYTFKCSNSMPIARAGLAWMEMVEQYKIFEFTATFEPLNP